MEKKRLALQEIQKYIHDETRLDGWLIYDFRGSNDLGLELLGIDPDKFLTRRFFYWIPKQGSPLKIVHQIEADTLKHLPGDRIAYESWQSLDLALKSTLRARKRIAMEHSPMGTIPVLAKLDAGLYQWLQEKKIEVVSSWPIAKHFVCRWDSQQFKYHKEAASLLNKTFDSSFERVSKALRSKKTITEYDLQQEILETFHKNGVICEHAPIVACRANSALPHYCPTEKVHARIENESLLLIDISCKKDKPKAPYADFTQMAYFGKKAPSALFEVYNTVKKAQESAINYIKKTLQSTKELLGCDVDDVARSSIQKSGYGKHFVHRTGHNIHTNVHGPGANLDNFETHDDRPLMPLTCCSVEPGIYIPKQYGVRLECNVFIHDDCTLEVTGRSKDVLKCYE